MASLTVTVLNGAPTDCGTAVNCIAKSVHISLRKRNFRAQHTAAIKHSRQNTAINLFTMPATQQQVLYKLGYPALCNSSTSKPSKDRRAYIDAYVLRARFAKAGTTEP